MEVDFNSFVFQHFLKSWKPRVIWGPAKDSAIEPKIAPLFLVSGNEGAIGVVSNYEGGNFFSSKGTHQSADPVCGGTVRTARAAHHGTKDIVKNAGRNLHRFCYGKNDPELGLATGWISKKFLAWP
jgi:hypothetical protein